MIQGSYSDELSSVENELLDHMMGKQLGFFKRKTLGIVQFFLYSAFIRTSLEAAVELSLSALIDIKFFIQTFWSSDQKSVRMLESLETPQELTWLRIVSFSVSILVSVMFIYLLYCFYKKAKQYA